MSIYSGFSTRKIQQTYNIVLFKIIQLLQNQVANHIIQQQKISDFPSSKLISFSDRFIKLTNKLKSFQQRKYLPPKFSNAVQGLFQRLENTQLIIKHLNQIQNPNIKKINDFADKLKKTQIKPLSSQEFKKNKILTSTDFYINMNKSKINISKKSNINKKIYTESHNDSHNDLVELNDFNLQQPQQIQQIQPSKPKLKDNLNLKKRLLSYSDTKNIQSSELNSLTKNIQIRNPLIFSKADHRKRLKSDQYSIYKQSQRYQ